MEKFQVQKWWKKLQMYRVSYNSLILTTPPMEINKTLNLNPNTSKRHIYNNLIISMHAFSN
jgi:hypothetical protein